MVLGKPVAFFYGAVCRRSCVLAFSLTALLFVGAANPVFAQELKGPLAPAQSATPDPASGQEGMAGLSESGKDALMTQDMLLVGPASAQEGTAAAPLKAAIGMTLKIEVEPAEVLFKGGLRGLAITVVNETNKPLVIDGDGATAFVGDKSYRSAPLSALQLAINPEHGIGRVAHDLVTVVAPAGATIGALPTVEDLYKSTKAPLTKYGKDQERRVAESTRFGQRILWPREKTRGIIYFKTPDVLKNARLEIPVNTLFDKKDAGVLITAPR